jgi:hypothetical protein
MDQSPPTDVLRARRRVLRALFVLRAAVARTEQALVRLTDADAERARRACPIPAGTTLSAAIDTWCTDVADGFQIDQPAMLIPAGPEQTAGWPSARAVMTYGAILAAFSHLPTDEALVYLVAADRAMDVLDDRPAMPAREQLELVAGQFDLLHASLAAVADGLRAMPDPGLPAIALQPHPALTARGSPFALETFRPMPELAALAQRECTACGRVSSTVAHLPVCQMMFLERHAAPPGTETGIAVGFLSVDGWIFDDVASATVFAATCPDHVDIAHDVRPFDARYFEAYLEHFGHAERPFESAVRYRRMMEVVRHDPFAAPG